MARSSALAIFAVLAMTACDRHGSYTTKDCLRSHAERQEQVANGVNSLGQIPLAGIVWANVDVCDAYGPAHVVNY